MENIVKKMDNYKNMENQKILLKKWKITNTILYNFYIPNYREKSYI